MPKKSKGVFIALDGIDGSGKATQTRLLVKRLKKEGYPVKVIDFPQYGKKSAGLVESYLNGAYGGASDVDPRAASLFYACDRYDASFQIRQWLQDGFVVISDRYMAASIGHQGGKLIGNKKRWKAYVSWLYDTEYRLLGISKPDVYFIFDVPASLARAHAGRTKDPDKLAKRAKYLGRNKQDIHERDEVHLDDARRSFHLLAKEYPRDFTFIACSKDGEYLSRPEIHETVWKKLRKSLVR